MALLKKLAENSAIKVQGRIPSIDEVMLETIPAMEVADMAEGAIPDGDEDDMDDGDNLEGNSKSNPEEDSGVAGTGDTAEWVRPKAFRQSAFSDEECNVVLRLAGHLYPYVHKKSPGKSSISHVPLHAPTVLIANSVFRSTGCREFTRKMAPVASTPSLHSLALGVMGAFEIFCAKGGMFNVNDASGEILTMGVRATLPENKPAIFGAFFDLERSKMIYDNHGLRFYNHIVYVDPYIVHLVGNVIPNGGALIRGSESRNRRGHPVVSHIDQEKKRRKGSKATSKWTLEFQAQPLDSKEVKKMVDKLSAEIQNMEAAIKKPRETAGKGQTAQTLLHRALKRAIPVKDKSDKKKIMESPIYKELEVKRYENRVVRKDLLEMENKLRAKRRELHYYSSQSSRHHT
ncbi:hypothetical protein BG011_006431 [Mortierella polycephala]|uniref:Uncharacterized protein n=1 Tax=Mortierella polycephala TaxID=41804 RepID=A0A9P6PST8_9FUNG|nr:hypothetical protein BG011_006431 [Mortierella polycephala]